MFLHFWVVATGMLHVVDRRVNAIQEFEDMKISMRALALSAVSVAALFSGAAAHAADVGVSVQISQPGVYGRVDIGNYPQPQVVYQQPVIIQRPAPVVVVGQPAPVPPQPIYMWVPPGHQKNWRKHCHQYNACGVPVYFVKDQWYHEHVHHDHDDHDHDHDRDDRGHGRGKGHH